MEGYMLKKGRGRSVSFIRPWVTRYFVLDIKAKELRYYEKDDKIKCKGILNLAGLEVFDCKDSYKGFCFEIRVEEDNGILLLSTPDASTKEMWISAFSKLSPSHTIRASLLAPESTIQQAHEDFFHALELNPTPARVLRYGTAGFRDNWRVLPSVFLRMGTLAALRSRYLGGKSVGIMITASHNPENDNGIKIVDSDGGMLCQDWEPHAEQFANCKTSFHFLAVYYQLAEALDALDETKPANVIIGRDTRPHSYELFERVCLGIRGICGNFYDIGEVTTPQLHFVVQKSNLSGRDMSDFLACTALKEYHETLAKGFVTLRESFPMFAPQLAVTVDAAYGVGGIALSNFIDVLTYDKGTEYLKVDIRNMSKTGAVNDKCGAELVQKGRRPPYGVDAGADEGKLICSFDGDADRIVFHSFMASPEEWVLFDGDKIAALVSAFLMEEIKCANLDEMFHMGVVQTAYANGGATSFLRERGIDIVFTKTGVKYLHHAALEFDIGVYFEANGHGTVVFSSQFKDRIQSYEASGISSDERKDVAFGRLKACLELINQSVGDALSDMLLVLIALQALNLDVEGWHSTYMDLPSRQTKVPVTNKDIIACSEDEKRVDNPKALQDELEVAMQSTNCGRCFVRPSGTEDYVRVYAEADTQKGADDLALACVRAINNHVGIIGEVPSSF